ncbi:MAG: MliC family protein [Alphaproteobacteria bacterium]
MRIGAVASTMAAVFAFAGCAMVAPEPAPSAERIVLYDCVDGGGFTARFAPDGDSVALDFGTGPAPLVLPRQATGSGFLYETPRHSLRGKGAEAHWTVGRRMPVQCRSR